MEPGATPTETAPAPQRRRLWLAHAYLWLSGLLTLVVLLEANGATYEIRPRVVAILLACIVLGLPFASVVLSRGGRNGWIAGLTGAIAGTVLGIIGLYEWARTSSNIDAFVIFILMTIGGAIVVADLVRRAPAFDAPGFDSRTVARRLRVVRIVSIGGIATVLFGAYQFWYESDYVPSQLPHNVVMEVRLEQEGPLDPATRLAPFKATVKVTNSSPSKVQVVGDWYNVAVTSPDVGPQGGLGGPPASVGSAGAAQATPIPTGPPFDLHPMMDNNDVHSVMGRYERASSAQTFPWRLVQSGELAGYGWWFEPGESWSTSFVIFVPQGALVARLIAGMDIVKGDRLDVLGPVPDTQVVAPTTIARDQILREVRYGRTQHSFLAGFTDEARSLVVAWVGSSDGMRTEIVNDDATHPALLDLADPRDANLISDIGLVATFGAAEEPVCLAKTSCHEAPTASP